MARSKKEVAEKYNAPFPSTLRHLMDERSVTQNDLSDITGKTRQTISQYVNGISEPGYDTLVKIAQFFNVSTDYLLGLSKTMTLDISIREMVKQTGISEENILRLIAWNNLEAVKETYTENSPAYISSICDLSENMTVTMTPEDLRTTIIDFSNCLLNAYLNSPGMITRSYLNYMGSLFAWYKALKNNSEDRIYYEAYKTDVEIQEYGLVTLTAEDSAKYCLSGISNMLFEEIDRISKNIVFSAVDE